MLSKITWTQFTAAVIILLLCYYSYVAIRYYRKDIRDLLQGKLKKNHEGHITGPSDTKENTAADELDELEMVVQDLRYAILEKAGKQTSKAELLKQLQKRLESYSGLRKPAFRLAINNYLVVHAQEICGISFRDAELNAAWQELMN